MQRFEVLTSLQIEDIHSATLDVLSKTGVRFDEPRALTYLESAGADVDHKRRVVLLSESLVQEGLRKVPKRFTWHARDPKHNLIVGEQERTYAIPGYGASYVIDLEGIRRPGTYKDLANLTRLADGLPYVDAAGGLLIEPSDKAPSTVYRRVFLTMVQNTTKCLMGYTLGRDVALDSIKMASILAGGEEQLSKAPSILGLINNKSPLEYDRKMSEAVIEYSERRLPLVFTPGPIAGATSPVTLAATLVQQNAEALSGIVLSQLIRPGTPNVYGSASSIMDMRTGTLSVASPESILLTLAGTQMAKHYGLPSRASCTLSDAKVPDAQAGYEKAMASVLSSLVGLNMSTWVGLLESLLATSPAQMVIDNEIWGMIRRIHRRFDVTPDTLALSVIAEGSKGTGFLGHQHTLKFHGREQSFPTLSDRNTHGAWKAKGERSTMQRAAEEAEKIMKAHEPEPLDRDILSQLVGVAGSTEEVSE